MGRNPMFLAAILEPARAAGVIPATAIADEVPSNLPLVRGRVGCAARVGGTKPQADHTLTLRVPRLRSHTLIE